MIILASHSPRRKELLEAAGVEFKIEVIETDESIKEGTNPAEAVRDLSRRKAEAVAKRHPGDTVIGADTVVSYNGEIFGKPADGDDAFDMLKKLSGEKHSVFTGVTIIRGAERHTFSEETKVEFIEASDDELKDYIDTGEPADKAGAYAIQGIGKFLVRSYSGDYNNVIGLPVDRVVSVLNEIGALE